MKAMADMLFFACPSSSSSSSPSRRSDIALASLRKTRPRGLRVVGAMDHSIPPPPKPKRKSKSFAESEKQLPAVADIALDEHQRFETGFIFFNLDEEEEEEENEDADYYEDDAELSKCRGLVLDLTYKPINVVCWRRALCLEILEKADVLEYYDEIVNSPSRAFPIPAVLRIPNYVHSPKKAKVKLALNRNSILLRDRYMCQYCKARGNLTIDHVVPLSRGGGWTWENLVTACGRCNSKKGDKTLDKAKMELIRPPKEPRELDSRDFPSSSAAYKTLTCRVNMPHQWLDYLSRKPPQFDI